MAILVRGVNSSKILHLQPIATQSSMAISVRQGNSPKVLQLQTIAAHSYMALSVRGGKSSKFLPMLPIAAHSYMAILVKGGFNSSKSFLWQTIAASSFYGNYSHGSLFLKSSPFANKCSQLLHGILFRGCNSSKCSPCSPLQTTFTWLF